MTSTTSSGTFARASRAATRLLGRNRAVERLVAAAGLLLQKRGSRLVGFKTELLALLRMLRQVVSGRYRQVPQRTLLAALAGLVYFVNPLDLIPDAVLLVGFLDDLAVLAWVLRQVRRDLDAFLVWEREWGATIDVEGRVEPQERHAHPPTPPALPSGSPNKG